MKNRYYLGKKEQIHLIDLNWFVKSAKQNTNHYNCGNIYKLMKRQSCNFFVM